MSSKKTSATTTETKKDSQGKPKGLTQSAAAMRLLDRNPPADYLDYWTREIAEKKQTQEAGETVSVLIFRLGEEWLAFPAKYFVEVAAGATFHSLPHVR